MFNQTIATTTSFDSLGIEQGYTVEVSTFGGGDLIIVAIQVAIFLFTLMLFIRKR